MHPTAVVCVVAVIVVGVYDAVAVTMWGVDGSVSRYLQDTAVASPITSFGFGFIAGHVFGYMPPRVKTDD